MRNPYLDVDIEEESQQTDNPYVADLQADLESIATMNKVASMKAAMTDAAKAKRHQDLAEKVKTPVDIIAAAPEMVEQNSKALDIESQLSLFPAEEQEWFRQNQNLEALQDDLPRLKALEESIIHKDWYDQTTTERFASSWKMGSLRRQQGFAGKAALAIAEDLEIDDRMSEFLANNELTDSVAGNVAAFRKAYPDIDGKEYGKAMKIFHRLRNQSLVPTSPEDMPDAYQDMREAPLRLAKKTAELQGQIEEIPSDPYQIQSDGIWDTAVEIITQNPGSLPQEFTKSMSQSWPMLAMALATKGKVPSALMGASGSFMIEEPSAFMEGLQREGVDLNDADAFLKAVNDPELMAKIKDQARKKAESVAGTDIAMNLISAGMLSPKVFRGKKLTNAQRGMINQVVQAPIQAIGEGAGEALGQYRAYGEVDSTEVAMEALVGGMTSPVETFVYGAQHYRRGKKAKEYLQAAIDTANESRKGNADDRHIKDMVKIAKKRGPVDEVYIDAGELRDILDQNGLDMDDIAQRMPEAMRDLAEAEAIGGDLTIPLEEFVTVLGNTAAAEQIVDAVRVDPNGMSAKAGQKWLTEDGKKYMQAIIEADFDIESSPGSKIANDLTGQLVQAGYDQGIAETEAKRMATTFVRMAAMSDKDAMEVYEQYGPQIKRDLGEAGRKVRKVTGMDNMLDRLRAGEVPSNQDIYGQSLVEFLRDSGGIIDDGGEIDSMDADLSRGAFERKLVQETGMTLDDAAEKAVEAGYIAERDPNMLLEKIASEIRGESVYSDQQFNQANMDLAADLEVIGDELAKRGIDVASMSNDEIIAAINEASEGAVDSGLEQPETKVKESRSPFAEQFLGGLRFETSNGVLDVVQPEAAPYQNSIVNFVVDESARGQGQGGALLDAAIDKYGDSLGGAFSSKESLTAAYNRGFRGLGEDYELTLDELESLRSELSSVTMQYDSSVKSNGATLNQDMAYSRSQSFGDLEISDEFELDDTGEIFRVSQPAQRLWSRLVKRRDTMESIGRCLDGS